MYTVLLYVLRYLAGKQRNERAQRLFKDWAEQLRGIECGKRERLLDRMQPILAAAAPGSLDRRYLIDTVRGVEENLREVKQASLDEVVGFWWLNRLGAKSPDRCINSIREMTLSMRISLILEVAEVCSHNLSRPDGRQLPGLNPGAVVTQAKRLTSLLEAGEFDRANQLLWDHEGSWALCSAPLAPGFRPPVSWRYSDYGDKPALVTA